MSLGFAPSVDPSSDFAAYTGYYILGSLLNWGLYGALCAQIYLYYLAFPEDRPLNKVLVYGVCLVETVQTMILLYNGIPMYNFQSDYYWSPFLLEDVVLWVALPVLGGIVAFVVQSFYAYRLRILARSWTIFAIIVLLALTQLILSLLGGAYMFSARGILPSSIKYFSTIWGGFSIICDLVIAIAMTYFLLRNDRGLKSTHMLLVKLIRLAVETGTVTMLLAAAYLAMIFFGFRDGSFSWQIPLLILGKVYANAMMVNFNQRIRISGGRDDTQITALETSGLS